MSRHAGTNAGFEHILKNFSSLPLNRRLTETEKVHVGRWLEELIKWNFAANLRELKNEAFFLVHRMCSVIAVDNAGLVIKVALAIEKLVCAHQVNLHGPAIRVAFDWCFSALYTYGESKDVLPSMHVLRALFAMYARNAHADKNRMELFDQTRIEYFIMSYLRRAADPERRLLMVPLAMLASSIVTTFDIDVELSGVQRLCFMSFFRHGLRMWRTPEKPRGDMLLLTASLAGVRALAGTEPWINDPSTARLLAETSRMFITTGLHSPHMLLPNLAPLASEDPFPRNRLVLMLNAPTPPYLNLESSWETSLARASPLSAPPSSPLSSSVGSTYGDRAREAWEQSMAASQCVFRTGYENDCIPIDVDVPEGDPSAEACTVQPTTDYGMPVGNLSPDRVATESAALILLSLSRRGSTETPPPALVDEVSAQTAPTAEQQGYISLRPISDLTYENPPVQTGAQDVHPGPFSTESSTSTLISMKDDMAMAQDLAEYVDSEDPRSPETWWRARRPVLWERHRDPPTDDSSMDANDIYPPISSEMSLIAESLTTGQSVLDLSDPSSLGSLSQLQLSPGDSYSSVAPSPPLPAYPPPAYDDVFTGARRRTAPIAVPTRPLPSRSPGISPGSAHTSSTSSSPMGSGLVMRTQYRSPRPTPYFLPELPNRPMPSQRDMVAVVISDDPTPIATGDPMLEAIDLDWDDSYPADVPKTLPLPLNAYCKLNDINAREQALLLLLSMWQAIDDETLSRISMKCLCPENYGGRDVPYTHNLLCNILKDDPMNINLALNAIQLVFTRCKSTIFNVKATIVNPEWVSTQDVLEHLHMGLCRALARNHTGVRTKVLKLLATLAHNSDYSKLKKGLCEGLLRTIGRLVQHPDHQLQVLALGVVNGILGHSAIPEIEEALLLSNIDQAISLDEGSVGAGDEYYANFEGVPEEEALAQSWLVERCYYNIHNRMSTVPVMVESLQIVAALCERYFRRLIMPFLKTVAETLRLSLCRLDNLDVLYHAAKATEKIGVAIEKNHMLPGCLDESLIIWQHMLEEPLTLLVGSNENVLRASAIDCIACIGEHTYQLLPAKVQVLCITTVLAYASDSLTLVRSAALRSLSVLLTFPSAREYSGFVIDGTDILLKAMEDSNKAIRLRASWGLGNISEALLSDGDSKEVGIWSRAGVSPLLQRLLTAATSGCADQERVRTNCLRALGNLLKVLHAAETCPDQFAALNAGVDFLISAAKTETPLMKVRWNACYALGNVLGMSCVYVVILQGEPTIASRIFNALGWIIKGCPNFKVRVKAAAALLQCTTRDGFGQEYAMLWGMLAGGLASIAPDECVAEKYQLEQLVDQTCISLGHLTMLARPDDLDLLGDILANGCHVRLRYEAQFVFDRLRQTGCEQMYGANSHIKALMNDITDPYPEQMMALDMLKELFTDSNV